MATDPRKVVDALIVGRIDERPTGKVATVVGRHPTAIPRSYLLSREGSKVIAVELEDAEVDFWKLELLPKTAKKPRPDCVGWWCFDYIVGVSADTALQVVVRPEGLTVLGYSEEPTLVSALPDRGAEAWVGPFERLRR